MEIQLLAASFEDGWAFVRIGNLYYAIQPPYRKLDRTSSSKLIIEKAILQHGFQAKKEDFPNWGKLIEFLKTQTIEKNKDISLLPQKELGQSMLHLAPKHILEEHLSKIEKEFVTKEQWNIAANLLMDMLSLELVIQNIELQKKVLSLLKLFRNKHETEKKKKALLLKRGVEEIKKPFTALNKKYDLDSIIQQLPQIRNHQPLYSS